MIEWSAVVVRRGNNGFHSLLTEIDARFFARVGGLIFVRVSLIYVVSVTGVIGASDQSYNV